MDPSGRRFLQASKDTTDAIHDFAKNRVIPGEKQISSLREIASELTANQPKKAVEAMAASLASLRDKAIGAGVTQKKMPSSFSEMLQWSINTCKQIITAMEGDDPLMKAARKKLTEEQQTLTRKSQVLSSMGGEEAYTALAKMVRDAFVNLKQ